MRFQGNPDRLLGRPVLSTTKPILVGEICVNLDEPKGWHRLREMAERASDSTNLARIIDEMNRLLDEHQQVAQAKSPYGSDSRKHSPAIGLEVQAWK